MRLEVYQLEPVEPESVLLGLLAWTVATPARIVIKARTDDPESGNPCELSNHSFSSRCRAYADRSAQTLLGSDRRL